MALLRRNARTQWQLAARLAGALTLFSMVMLGLTSNRSGGRSLFIWLFALGIAGVLTRGFGLTADLFSEERRNGTLGLLILTGLRPLEVFGYKLLGAVMLSSYALLGGLPFFAIPFLAGGVPLSQFLCALVFLANALFFCVAVGLLASVIHRDGGQAQFTAQALAALLCAATPTVHWFASLAGRPSAMAANWLALSPAYPGYLVFSGFAKGSPHLFWLGSDTTLVYSLAALLLAALILQRTWRDSVVASAPAGWRQRWQARARGGRKWREQLRARLLAEEPFCWLAARDRPPVLLAYAVVVLAAALWLAACVAAGPRWLRPPNAFMSSIALHLVLNLISAYAAGRRFAEERLIGGFEILLTAPLKTAEIVDGQYKAVLVQFRGVAACALLFDVILCWTSLAALNPSTSGAVVYGLAWLLMLGYWFSMHLASAARAMWISA